jgi:hypothetical protein
LTIALFGVEEYFLVLNGNEKGKRRVWTIRNFILAGVCFLWSCCFENIQFNVDDSNGEWLIAEEYTMPALLPGNE